MGKSKDAGDKTEVKAKHTRQHHTRSRAGCLACKKKHTRCDEAKPVCFNCKANFRQCEYPQPALPLRERRKQKAALPGSQDVWVVAPQKADSTPSASSGSTNGRQSTSSPSSSSPSSVQLFPSAGVDPFDSFSIHMPFESIQLLRYFHHSADAFGFEFKDPRDDCLAKTVDEPASFRSSLLLASLHHAWNTGSLSHFEPTYLYHKLDSIRSINELINNPNPKSVLDCVKQVATLCLAEACLGNLPVAESHLQGLLTVVDTNADLLGGNASFCTELVNRYLLLVSTFVYVFKSRLHDISSNDGEDSQEDKDMADSSGDPMRSWHIQETNGLYIRLMSFRLMPRFFTVPPDDVVLKPIPVAPYITCLKAITDPMDARDRAPTPEAYAKVWNRVWMEGGSTRMLYVCVESHSQSMSYKPVKGKGLKSCWTAFNATAALYFNCVLNMSNGGQLMEPRLLQRIMGIVERDLEQTKDVIQGPDSPDSDLWLWKAFVGAFGVFFAERCDPKMGVKLQAEREVFHGYVRDWTAGAKVDWTVVRKVLGRIAWPSSPPKEMLSKTVWEGMATNPPPEY